MRVYSHSQGDWDRHLKDCTFISFDSKEYKHGWDGPELFDHLLAMGLVDYGDEAFAQVYQASTLYGDHPPAECPSKGMFGADCPRCVR
jgi:hypothetical protein